MIRTSSFAIAEVSTLLIRSALNDLEVPTVAAVFWFLRNLLGQEGAFWEKHSCAYTQFFNLDLRFRTVVLFHFSIYKGICVSPVC